MRSGKIYKEMLGNSEILRSRSIELKSRSIETFSEVDRSNLKSIDRNSPELAFAEAHQNAQSGASP